MSRWIFSLQFRLILGFALVLALALIGVSLYVGFAADREVERFWQDLEAAKTARIEQALSRHFSEQR